VLAFLPVTLAKQGLRATYLVYALHCVAKPHCSVVFIAPNRAQETFSEGDDGSGEVLKQSQTEDYCNQSTDECGSKDFTDRKLAAEASDFFTKVRESGFACRSVSTENRCHR